MRYLRYLLIAVLALSEFRSDQEFAAIESAHVSLALLPLLSRQLVVNEVTIRGVRANLVRFRDGSMNIDDLLIRDEQKQVQFTFDIEHVAIERSAINFRDEAEGAEYAVSGLNLKTGRIASGVPTRIGLSLAIKGNQPRLALDATVKTQLTFDLDLKRDDLTVKGRLSAARTPGLVRASR